MLNVEAHPIQSFEPHEVDIDALSEEITAGPILLNMMRYMVDLVRD